VTNVVASVGLLQTLQAAQAGVGDLNVEFWQRLETLQEISGRDQRDELLASDGSELALSDSCSQHSDSNGNTVESRVMNLLTNSVQVATQVLTVLSDMIYYRLDEENKHRWDTTNGSIHDFYVRLKESPHTLTTAYLARMRELFNYVSESVDSGLHYAAGKIQSGKKDSLHCE
jgi:hypothetical protein